MTEEEKRSLRELEAKRTLTSGGLTAGETTTLSGIKNKQQQHLGK